MEFHELWQRSHLYSPHHHHCLEHSYHLCSCATSDWFLTLCSVSDIFYLTYLWDSSIFLLCVSSVFLFSAYYFIVTVLKFSCSPVDWHWVVSSFFFFFWLLWIKLCVDTFSFLLGEYLQVRLLFVCLFVFLSDCTTWLVGSYFPNQGSLGSKSWVLTIGCQGFPIAHIFLFSLFLFYIWSNWQTFSPEGPHHFTVTSATCQSSSFSTSSLTHDVLSVPLVLAILIDVCRYIIMVLTCFSLMANDFEHLQGLIGLVCVL